MTVGERAFLIQHRPVGGSAPVFIVAEAGVNHNGDPALATRLVDAAADAGADAVKFQTFSARALVSPQAPKAAYQRETTGSAESQLDMLARLELSLVQHAVVQAHAAGRGLLFFSTPFDEASADLLQSLGVLLFKLPSDQQEAGRAVRDCRPARSSRVGSKRSVSPHYRVCKLRLSDWETT